MSWDTTLVQVLRVLINDTESPQIYTDTYLQQILLNAAVLVQSEMYFDTLYTIDLDNLTIVPDPFIQNTNNSQSFWTLFTVKAGCIIDQKLLREKSVLSGIGTTLGPVSFDTSPLGRAYSDAWTDLLSMGLCASYEQLKNKYEFGHISLGEAILSPFVNCSGILPKSI